MKNKKAFTLIELLAVIVVLAVILAISIPAVTGIVNSARKKAFSESARLIVTAAINKGGNDGTLDLASIDVTNVKTVLGVKNTNYNSVSLNKDNDSIYLVVSGRGEWGNLKACGTYHKMVVTDLSDASVCPEVVVDSDPGIICDYDTESVCHIRSVEDLTAFSVMVNDPKHNYDFTDHTVILDTNLDIQNPASYVSSTTLAFGDINGDGFVSSLIKELTTKNGFQPIGSKDKKFKGTFEGEARTISNLYINRPSLVYTGLFGYNAGIIRGLDTAGFNITGGVYTAGIAAYNTGMISSVVFNGSIDSNQNQYMGFISSRNDSIVNGVLVKNSTSKEYLSGDNSIAPNSDWSANETTVGLSESCISGVCSYTYVLTSYSDNTQNINGNISNQINAYGYVLDTWIGGDNDSDGYYFDYNSSDQIILKSVTHDPMTFNLTGDGTETDPYLINDYSDWKQATLKVRNGYYFKVTNNINFNDKKYYAMGDYTNYFSGYFNGDSNELSNVNFMIVAHGGMFGSNTGTIEGIIVDNLTLVGGTYTGGITESNTGIIKGITIKNMNMSGPAYYDEYVGGITGVNNGSINTIDITGNITTHAAVVGGVAGTNLGTIYNALANVNVSGSSHIGILLGSASKGSSLSGVISGGTVAGNYLTGSAIGSVYSNSNAPAYTLVYTSLSTYYNNLALCPSNYSAQPSCSFGPVLYEDPIIRDLNALDDILDTWIGGDNDSDGYYFDNIDNLMVIRSAIKYPMNFDLNGSGTNDNPYLINDYQDWKQAALRPTSGYVYKLNNNIDFNDKYSYALGTDTHWFNGVFDGNGKSISNLSMKGIFNTGIFGHVTNTGTIENLKLSNLNSYGNYYVGGLAGINDGTIKEIDATLITISGANVAFAAKAGVGSNDSYYPEGGIVGVNYGAITGLNVKNINISTSWCGSTGGIAGFNHGSIIGLNIENLAINVGGNNGSVTVGGVTGWNYGNISSIALQGIINPTSNIIGGIAGINFSNITNVLVNVNIKTQDNSASIGGIVGTDSSASTNQVKGVVEGGIIGHSYDWCGKLVGSYNEKYYGYSSESVSLTSCPRGGESGISFGSINDNNLTKYDEYELDTKFSGDKDLDGYYFDYNSDQSNIIVKSFIREPVLILKGNHLVEVLSEGDSAPIINYFALNPASYPGVTVSCTKQDGSSITNVDQIAFGKDTVSCKMHLTTPYGTFTGNTASVDFVYKYLAHTELGSCPSGYSLSNGMCSKRTGCATSEHVDVAENSYAGCYTPTEIAAMQYQTISCTQATGNQYCYLTYTNSTNACSPTETGKTQYSYETRLCTSFNYSTVEQPTVYSCNRNGVTGTGSSTNADLKPDHYCYFREFSPPEDLISGTTFGFSTGGWRFYHTFNNSNFIKSGECYNLYTSWDTGVSTIQTNKKINLTFYNKITLNVDMSHNDSWGENITYVGVYSANETTATLNFTKSASTTTSSATAVNKVITLDVSDLTGEFYVKVAVNLNQGFAGTSTSKINSLKIE